jgi:hypothetical protein
VQADLRSGFLGPPRTAAAIASWTRTGTLIEAAVFSSARPILRDAPELPKSVAEFLEKKAPLTGARGFSYIAAHV